MCIIWVGKIVLIFLFLLIGSVSFFGTFGSWRDVHNYAHDFKNETWIDKYDVKMYYITPWHGVYFSDTTLGKIFKVYYAACSKDFEKGDDKVMLPEESGFYGDYAVISLLLVAFVVCIFNIIWTIISFFAFCCDKFFLYVLPATTFFVTVLLITSTIIFSVDVDNYYGRIPVDFVKTNGTPFYDLAKGIEPGDLPERYYRNTTDIYKGAVNLTRSYDGNCVYLTLDGQFPFYIKYGAGFYLTIISIGLNVGAFVLSLFVSFLRKFFCM